MRNEKPSYYRTVVGYGVIALTALVIGGLIETMVLVGSVL